MRSYSNTCVILGHRQSRGRGEELSVLILMLIPPKSNALDEEGGSGLIGAGVTQEVLDMKMSLKSSTIFSYMFKPSQLLTKGFGDNRTADEKLFKHMCNFGSQAE